MARVFYRAIVFGTLDHPALACDRIVVEKIRMLDGVLATAGERAGAFVLFGSLLLGGPRGVAGLALFGEAIEHLLQSFLAIGISGSGWARPYGQTFGVGLHGPIAEMNVALGVPPFEYFSRSDRIGGLG